MIELSSACCARGRTSGPATDCSRGFCCRRTLGCEDEDARGALQTGGGWGNASVAPPIHSHFIGSNSNFRNEERAIHSRTPDTEASCGTQPELKATTAVAKLIRRLAKKIGGTPRYAVA